MAKATVIHGEPIIVLEMSSREARDVYNSLLHDEKTSVDPAYEVYIRLGDALSTVQGKPQ